MNKQKVYTIKQVQDLMGVCRNTVYKWIKDGKLPAYQMGIKGKWKIREQDIPTWARDLSIKK